jgi:hypothetical protein
MRGTTLVEFGSTGERGSPSPVAFGDTLSLGERGRSALPSSSPSPQGEGN